MFTWLPGPPVSSVALIAVSPNGSTATGFIDVSITEETASITLHRLGLSTPLMPGVWTVHVVVKGVDGTQTADVTKVNFLVADTFGIRSDRVDAERDSALSAAWRVVGSCIITASFNADPFSCRPQSSSCAQTPWSTHYPDPKSWQGQSARHLSDIARGR
jgi:hypothetical protein